MNPFSRDHAAVRASRQAGSLLAWLSCLGQLSCGSEPDIHSTTPILLPGEEFDDTSAEEARSFVSFFGYEELPSSSPILFGIAEQPNGSATQGVSYETTLAQASVRLSGLGSAIGSAEFLPVSVPKDGQFLFAEASRAWETYGGTLRAQAGETEWKLLLEDIVLGESPEDQGSWLSPTSGEIRGEIERKCFVIVPINPAAVGPRAMEATSGAVAPAPETEYRVDENWATDFCARYAPSL